MAPEIASVLDRARTSGDKIVVLTGAGVCGRWMRPHVLWFDEVYDEPRYRARTALEVSDEAQLLIVVGTSGATSLPWQIGSAAQRRGIPIIDVNPEESPFSQLARASPGGGWLMEVATTGVAALVQRLRM